MPIDKQPLQQMQATVCDSTQVFLSLIVCLAQEKPRDEIVYLTELLQQPALPDLRLWQAVQQAAVSVADCSNWTNRPALTKVTKATA